MNIKYPASTTKTHIDFIMLSTSTHAHTDFETERIFVFSDENNDTVSEKDLKTMTKVIHRLMKRLKLAGRTTTKH